MRGRDVDLQRGERCVGPRCTSGLQHCRYLVNQLGSRRNRCGERERHCPGAACRGHSCQELITLDADELSLGWLFVADKVACQEQHRVGMTLVQMGEERAR
jgi:hypothetical protein